MAEEIIGVKVKVDASDVGKSVGSLKQQLREAQNEVNALSDKFGATSKEAINAAKKAAQLKDAIGDAKALTDAFNPDQKFKALSSSLSGAAGGFAALQGAVGLFGNKAEAVEKTLLKVQSALALSQGLEAVGNSIDSFKVLGSVIKDSVSKAFGTLRSAIISTGIGALVIGVGLLIANFETVKKVVLNFIPGLGKLADFVGNLVTKFTDFVGITSEADRVLEKLSKTNAKANENIEARVKLLTAQGGKEKEIYALQKEANVNETNALRERLKLTGSLTEEEAKRFRELKVENAVLDEAEKKRIADKKAEALKLKEDAAKDAAELLAKQEEGRQKARKAGEDFEKIVENNREKKKEQAAKDEEKRIEDDNKEVERLFVLEEKKLKVVIDASDKKIALDKKIADEELKAKEALENAKFQAAVAGLNLLFALAGQNEKVANALFVVDKALAIARIVVDTQKEIAGYASNPLWSALPDGGLLIKSKYALAAKIRAGASIASIAATTIGKFKNGSAPPQAGGIGGVGGAAPMQPASPQAQLTQLNQASINQMGSATGRAYVVESDITNSQEKIIRINRAARLG